VDPAYNPIYSGGRDGKVQIQHKQMVLETLSRKNPSQKMADGVVQGVGRVQIPVLKKNSKV
jgi:hypothetical protein